MFQSPHPTPAMSHETIAPFAWLPSLYFVLASLIGLICMVVGSVMILNTLLTQFVFVPIKRPLSPAPFPPLDEQVTRPAVPTALTPKTSTPGAATASVTLSPEEQAALERWRVDYTTWEQQEKNYDYEKEDRKRTYANALALLVVGLPVFVFHVPQIMNRKNRN